MSGAVVYDPAVPAVGAVINGLINAYRPDSSFPPANPSTDVHFFAGEGPAMAAWDAHTDADGCDAPFLWVRVMRRFRTVSLPEPAVTADNCRKPRVIAVEVGVGRCALTDERPTWEQYDAEAVLSLEDSWRIEMALCAAAAQLKDDGYLTATDEVVPYGPEGGVLAWTAVIYIQFAD